MIRGAGPVALIAALAAARRGRTTLEVRRWPPTPHRSRIDVIPAPFLTLLLELGISPRQLQVDHLHDAQLSAWEMREPRLRRRPVSAHVERAALELALVGAVERDRRITISAGTHDSVGEADVVMDATGRSATSASRRIAPPQVWHAETFQTELAPSKAVEAFRIAALPDGYVYRVGAVGRLMVGVVRWHSVDAEQTEDEIRRHDGGWLLQGSPPLSSMQRTRGGVCAIQWSEGAQSPLRVGDSNLARDALASQGVASGASDALQLASGELSTSDWLARASEQRLRHVAALSAALSESRFRHFSGWACYREFLARHNAPRVAD